MHWAYDVSILGAQMFFHASGRILLNRLFTSNHDEIVLLNLQFRNIICVKQLDVGCKERGVFAFLLSVIDVIPSALPEEIGKGRILHGLML